MHTKIQSTWQLINMELEENLLEIGKTIAGVTKIVRQIYQKYSSLLKKSRYWSNRKWNSWLDTNE